jgi:hypothetical protein
MDNRSQLVGVEARKLALEAIAISATQTALDAMSHFGETNPRSAL